MRVSRVVGSLALLVWTTLPASTGTAAAGSGSGLTAPRAAEGTAVLHDQLNNLSTPGVASQDRTEPGGDPFDSQAADDFTVPEGQSWTIDTVEVAGAYEAQCGGSAGPAQAVNVFFYADAGGLPGDEIASRLGLAPNAGPNFLVSFPNLTLVPGTYWVSVQSVQNCNTNGLWNWFGHTVQSGNGWVWRNPGAGFGSGCENWSNSSPCAGESYPGLAFRLIGNSYGCKGFYATQVGQAFPNDVAYASVVGTAGGDTLVGTGATDVVMGLTGNDTIKSKGGADLICAGPGKDKVRSGGGDDAVFGQGGNDQIKLGGGSDFVNAGGGRGDVCFGGAGDDAGRCEGGHP